MKWSVIEDKDMKLMIWCDHKNPANRLWQEDIPYIEPIVAYAEFFGELPPASTNFQLVAISDNEDDDRSFEGNTFFIKHYQFYPDKHGEKPCIGIEIQLVKP